MLAQSFLSARDLRITNAEHCALAKVLGMLERCELVYADQGVTISNGFNMSTHGRGCGTPACIGGWVATILQEDQLKYVDSYLWTRTKNQGLTELYWNEKACSGKTNAQPAQAAQALRSYLTTGDAQWGEALA